MKPAKLYVLAGPTAVGKGTIVTELVKRYGDRFFLSISATTRSPRPGEVDGKHYLFVDEATFKQMIADNQLLEYAHVHGQNYYGTPRRGVEEALAAGKPALLEIDLAGARQVRESFPEAVLVFMAPPSWEELKRRLLGRGTESAEEQTRRLETAKVELAAQSEFDLVIVNDEIDATTDKLAEIMGLA